MKIDTEILRSAVEKTIRPYLIDKGMLYDVKIEGYHHAKVIPTAQPCLTREALETDAVANVQKALKAHENLLSQFEFMKAKTLVEDADPGAVRDHVIDLLYGPGPLETRLKDFLEWAKGYKTADGANAEINATTASYLLAMSNPEEYAFCKPKRGYKPAAAALLKLKKKRSDAERVVHATEFYKAALQLFRDEHKLPFQDLMHVHIAFYVMSQGFDGLPSWEELEDSTSAVEKQDEGATMASMKTSDLNVILYGPPGTGKTYQTAARAVAICDGEAPPSRDEIVTRYKSLQSEGRIKFVTFHQSYGYEEFIEGIRPVLKEGGSDDSEDPPSDVRYECSEGVLKGICTSATAKVAKQGATSLGDLGTGTVWKMSLGNTYDPDHAVVYDDCIRDNLLLLGYGEEIDFSGCDSKEAIEAEFQKTYPETKKSDFGVQAVHAFKNRMKDGDLVVISAGNKKFRAVGRVAGDYKLLDRENYRQSRPVEWLVVFEGSLPRERIYDKDFSQATIYQLQQSSLKLDALQQLLAGDESTKTQNYVLIIDEINRGNIAKILGELITLLEPDKRLGAINEVQVTLPYSTDPFGVPSNLYVIGTMNTADRSIAMLDAALRRRFSFVEVMPDPDVIRRVVGQNGVVESIDLAKLLDAINRRVELLYDRDHQIGHSYFLQVSSLADLRDAFIDKVIPLLQEYFYGDWSKVCTILGCPYNPETAERLSGNNYPIIEAESLKAEDLPGEGQDEYDDKIRCSVARAFASAEAGKLVPFFQGVMG